KLELVSEQLVAVLVDETDVSGGDDLSAHPVPADGVGTHRLIAGPQQHVAGGPDHIGIAVVFESVGLEVDLLLARIRRRRGWRRCRLRRWGGCRSENPGPEVVGVGSRRVRRLRILRPDRERYQAQHGKTDDGALPDPLRMWRRGRGAGGHSLPMSPGASNCNASISGLRHAAARATRSSGEIMQVSISSAPVSADARLIARIVEQDQMPGDLERTLIEGAGAARFTGKTAQVFEGFVE